MKTVFAFIVGLSFAAWICGQTSQKPKTTAAPAPAPVKQQPAKRDPPTLGFNRLKDVPPIIDSDAMTEGQKLEKDLPKNEFVHTKEAMHETILMREFVEGFQSSKECHGITFYVTSEKKPDFTVQITVWGHDDQNLDGQTWTWILGYPGDPGSSDSKAHGIGGMGNQSTAKLTAKDVCLTIWDDVDPNHFKKPGGKIE